MILHYNEDEIGPDEEDGMRVSYDTGRHEDLAFGCIFYVEDQAASASA